MCTRKPYRHAVWNGLMTLMMVVLAFQGFGASTLAAPASRALLFQGGNPQALACTSSQTESATYCDVQLVLMIDDSGSMRTNDPQFRNPAGGLRNQGAKNLVDVLATQFYLPAVQLKAANPGVRLPDVRVAVMHFSKTLKEYSKEWIQINPASLEDWEKQRVDLYKLIDWQNTYESLQTTHFIEPFAKAAELFKTGQVSVQGVDCVRRSIMLFTDGTPEDVGGILQDKALEDEMNKVKAIVQDDLAGMDVRIYVTGFKVKPSYWVNVEPYWTEIVGTPAPDETLARSVLLQGEDSLIQMASRMEEITASLVNIQSLVLTADPQDRQSFSVEVPKHTDSLRLTLYNLDPQAGLQITDPAGNQIAPDGQNVILSGETTSVEVWQLIAPAAGSYKVKASKSNGILTGLLTYQNLAVQFDPDPARLQEGAESSLKFKLLDSSGNAVLPGDDPAYSLGLKVFVTLAGKEEALDWKQDGDQYQVTWTPGKTGDAQLRVETNLTSPDGNVLWNCTGEAGTRPVDPGPTPTPTPTPTPNPPPQPPERPTLEIATPAACVPAGQAIVLPIKLKYDGDRSWASTLQWDVSTVAQPGEKSVNASVTTVNAENGDYQLNIDPVSAKEVQLRVSAKAEIEDQPVDISGGEARTIQVCASACACDPSWTSWFWFLAIVLILLLLLLLVFRSRLGREDNSEEEEKRDQSRSAYWHLLFWPLLLLLILLILNRLWWCCIIPPWLFVALILILLIVLLLVWSSPEDEPAPRRPWWLLFLVLLVLVLIWFLLLGSQWLSLLGLLLLLILLIWIIRRSRAREKPFPWWWLLILATLVVTIWFIFFGQFPFWLILLLLLIWLAILSLVWIFFREPERRRTFQPWLALIVFLALALLALIFFGSYWISILLWLLVILVLIWIILWLIPSEPIPAEERKAPFSPEDRSGPVAPDEKDDLKLIEGIGPRVERLFNEHGIYTFRQLANADLAEVNRWLDENGLKYMDPKTWPRQAALADKAKTSGKKEDWDEFYKYTAALKGGIAPDEYNKPEKDRKPPEEP